MDLVGPSEFAKRKGVSNTLVFRALGNGRIKYHEDTKKIDWDTQSVAFDNNCNLKFKMAARTKGDLQRAIVSGKVSATPYQQKPVELPNPKPEPKPAPVVETKPEPKPEPKPKAGKDRPAPKVEKPAPEKTDKEKEDEEAERQAARERDTYNKARTAEQVYKAQILELELKQKRGELMPTAEVKKGVQKMAEFVKKGFDGLADRISDELAGMNDPHEIHALLTREHNQVYQELTNASAKFGS